jgi:hypothetical protein
MGIWDKLQSELNRAGRAAQGAIDEGKLRLEIFRVRQLADKAAQALGYAIYRARANNEELDAATSDRLMGTLREHEAEAKKLQEQLAQQATAEPEEGASPPPASEPAPADSTPSPPPSGV